MKIAVIADDLTGAAEFNGIALRFGCTTYLGLGTEVNAAADVIVMSTDSRSMLLSAALETTEKITVCISEVAPDIIFKKIDSVLRGYVLDEIKLQMKLLNKKRAIILPANPSMGRTIESGKYFIQGTLIHETAFAHDPDFPAKDASVQRLLRCAEYDHVAVLNSNDELPDTGIFIGNILSEDDLKKWVKKINSEMLIACGGDLFVAFMEEHHSLKQLNAHDINKPVLYVCGTTFTKSVSFVSEVCRHTDNVFYIPTEYFLDNEFDLTPWIKALHFSLKKDERAIVAIDPNQAVPKGISPLEIRKKTAMVVEMVISTCSISSLFIEGGSTAAAILNELNIQSLTPIHEIGRGVVTFQPKGLKYTISVKPGSYELPLALKHIFLPS